MWDVHTHVIICCILGSVFLLTPGRWLSASISSCWTVALKQCWSDPPLPRSTWTGQPVWWFIQGRFIAGAHLGCPIVWPSAPSWRQWNPLFCNAMCSKYANQLGISLEWVLPLQQFLTTDCPNSQLTFDKVQTACFPLLFFGFPNLWNICSSH